MGRLAHLGTAVALACAGAAWATPAWVPAPGSTLVTQRELPFRIATLRQGDEVVTTLALQRLGAEPEPLAHVAVSAAGVQVQVHVQRLPVADAALEQALLEQLYALVLRHEPAARYRWNGTAGELSQGELLRQLADARRALLARSDSPTGTPWEPVALQPWWGTRLDPQLVGVFVAAGDAPLAGVQVVFSRPPHEMCTARTQANGLAMCHLQDTHGDAHAHVGAGAPAVVTFPGQVDAGRLRPPTTAVVSAGR